MEDKVKKILATRVSEAWYATHADEVATEICQVFEHEIDQAKTEVAREIILTLKIWRQEGRHLISDKAIEALESKYIKKAKGDKPSDRTKLSELGTPKDLPEGWRGRILGEEVEY